MRDPANYNEVGKEKLFFAVNNPYIQKLACLMLAVETVVSLKNRDHTVFHPDATTSPIHALDLDSTTPKSVENYYCLLGNKLCSRRSRYSQGAQQFMHVIIYSIDIDKIIE